MSAAQRRHARACLRSAATRLWHDLLPTWQERRLPEEIDGDFIARHTMSFAVVVTVLVAGLLQ